MSNTTDKMPDRYVYLHLDHRWDGRPPTSEEESGITVHVKLGDEGVVVDAWQEDECIATTWKTYDEMGVEVKDIDNKHQPTYSEQMQDELEPLPDDMVDGNDQQYLGY